MGEAGVRALWTTSLDNSFDDVIPETPSPVIQNKKRRYIGGSKLAHDQARGVLRASLGSRAEPARKRIRQEALSRLQRQRQQRQGAGVHYFSDSDTELTSPALLQQPVSDTDPESDSDLIPAPMDVDTPARRKHRDFMTAKQLLLTSKKKADMSSQPSTSVAAMLTPPPEARTSKRPNGQFLNDTLSHIPSSSSSHDRFPFKSCSSASSGNDYCETISPQKLKSEKSCKHHKSSIKSRSNSKHERSKSHNCDSPRKSRSKHKHSSSSPVTSVGDSPRSSSHNHLRPASHTCNQHRDHHRRHCKNKSSKTSRKHKSKSQQPGSSRHEPSRDHTAHVSFINLLDESSDDDSVVAHAASPGQTFSDTSSDMEEEEWQQFMRTMRSPRKQSRRILSPERERSSEDSETSPCVFVSPATEEVTVDVETEGPLPSFSARISNRSLGEISLSRTHSSRSRRHRRTDTVEVVAMVNQIDEDAAMARQLQEEMDRQYAASLAMQSDLLHPQPETEQPPAYSPAPFLCRLPSSSSRGSGSNLRSRSTRSHPDPPVDPFGGLALSIMMSPHFSNLPQGWSRLPTELLSPHSRRRGPSVRLPPRPRSRRGRRAAVDGLSVGNDYEELLALGELLGEVQARPGLTPHQISMLPTYTFRAGQLREGEALPSCNICMCDAQEGDTLRSLLCFHSFHRDCIDQWIKDNPSCPVCRVEIKLN